MKQSQS